MFRSGAFVADHLGGVDDGQTQPNGVDLTVAAVHRGREPGRIDRDGVKIAERTEITPGSWTRSSQGGAADTEASADSPGAPADPDDGSDPADSDIYRLSPGRYVVAYGERIRVPEGHVGFVYPRSSLLRNSVSLHTAVWDAGYEGRGEGLLAVGRPIELQRGARIGQFVLAAADHEGTYDGSYQGERLADGT